MKLTDLTILIRGAGEMASGVAWRLFQSHFKILLSEIPQPLAVRRGVSFCEAVYEGRKNVEGVEAVLISSVEEVRRTWDSNRIPLIIDPDLSHCLTLKPQVLVDAVLAKKNIGTRLEQAPLVIALGPGFKAGPDANIVVETNRGHNLGRILTEGEAEADTGIPGNIGGFTIDRVLKAPAEGIITTRKKMGDPVVAGETVAEIGGVLLQSKIKGVLRGLIREGTWVSVGLKVGDVDPRGNSAYCYTISEKARAIAGSVLEGIMRYYNQDNNSDG